MSTISVPLPKEQEARLDALVKSGVAPTRAAVMRKALELLAEEEAVRAVLEAERELALGKGMSGDIRKLLKKF